MGTYRVRWYDPECGTPLVKWFYGAKTRERAQAFRERLPFLSELSSGYDRPKREIPVDHK
jgi:hypothetical protein